MPSVVVLGAGVVGVATAIAIQRARPDVKVTLMASAFSPNITSDIAAGYIQPYLCDDGSRVDAWTAATMERIEEFIGDNDGVGAGLVSGYYFRKDVVPLPTWATIMKHFTVLSQKEIDDVSHNPDNKTGYFFTTYYLEPTTYIAYNTRKFLENGGTLLKADVKSLDDVDAGFDVIVNCTGLGSKLLFDDPQLHPVRGQVVRVRCPQVKHFYNDDDYYVLQNGDCIILGGTADVGEYDTTFNEATAKRILEGALKLCPTLKSASILSHKVGLRPGRKSVRLEHKLETSPSGKTRHVVHNYGHGGSGVTLHWGCALEAAQLVSNVIPKSQM